MMREPWFWKSDSATAKLIAGALTPLSVLYEGGSYARRRFAKARAIAAPVVCVGAATVGGVGKTPFAIALAQALQARGLTPHVVSRGYGRITTTRLRVDLRAHSAADVGDEPLLLARYAPTWVDRDKAGGAAAAVRSGANLIIFDDGFQNPTVQKDCSILLINSVDPTGNGKVFPAGPLRERIETARARADFTIGISPDAAAESRNAHLYDHIAWLEGAPSHEWSGNPVLAFCGIANPERFFRTLQAADISLAATSAFDDHHQYDAVEITALKRRADELGAVLVTTEKDFVRLSPQHQRGVHAFPVTMKISGLSTLIDNIIAKCNLADVATP